MINGRVRVASHDKVSPETGDDNSEAGSIPAPSTNTWPAPPPESFYERPTEPELPEDHEDA